MLGGPLFYALDDAAAALRNARDVDRRRARRGVALARADARAAGAADPEPSAGASRCSRVVPFCTDLERGPALLEPLTSFGSPIASMHGPMPYAALQSALDDVDPHGHRYWERGDYLAGLSDDAIDALVGGARRASSSKRNEILDLPAGRRDRARAGRRDGVRRPHRAVGGLGRRASGPTRPRTRCHRDWTRSVLGLARARGRRARVYVNAIGGDVTEARKLAAYGGAEKLERLRELKRAWDPGNLFRRNHNVEP